jgi:hypothetical protein
VYAHRVVLRAAGCVGDAVPVLVLMFSNVRIVSDYVLVVYAGGECAIVESPWEAIVNGVVPSCNQTCTPVLQDVLDRVPMSLNQGSSNAAAHKQHSPRTPHLIRQSGRVL